ncbi:phosphatase PAP2 family protein [Nonomuraea sp. SYSU D8015]|uniref:phosphatase PAP2 family protein n=1 Tax=Nonomuraea sp. SYSU D8015 TaxID=2593644 RepID=UPI001CB6FFCC|nr:phosphatase PAP2 family protein [Nonomuraea sp. SYSU D8015]
MVLAGLAFTLVMGLVRVAWQPLIHFDRGVSDALNTVVAGNTVMQEMLQAVTDFGGFPILGRVVLLGTLFLLIRREVRLAVYVVVTSLGAMTLYNVLKLLVGRLRPVVEEPVAVAPGMSFPSGHAMSSLVSYGVLLLVFAPTVPRRLRPVVVAVVVALVALVGFTRVALGVHYFTDVLGGWLLGLAWLGITAMAFRRWRLETGSSAPPLREGLAPEEAPALAPAPVKSRPLPHPWRGSAELLVGWVLILGALFGTGMLITVFLEGTALIAADRAVVQWIAEHRTATLTVLTIPGNRVGSTQWILAGTLAACVLALAVLRCWRPILFVLVVMVGELSLFLTSATAVGRERPPVPHLGPELPPTSSFPSGHVAAALALYLAIAVLTWQATDRWWRWAAVAASVLIPLYCALSRMYRGVHYPSDILGSMLLALPWVAIAWWVLRPVPQKASADRMAGGATDAGRGP